MKISCQNFMWSGYYTNKTVAPESLKDQFKSLFNEENISMNWKSFFSTFESIVNYGKYSSLATSMNVLILFRV